MANGNGKTTVQDQDAYTARLRDELDKLSDRELLLEVAVNMALAAQVLQQVQQHPMVKKMIGG